MANFVDDYRDFIISDPSILAYFGNNILYGALPNEIDRDDPWFRWTIQDVEQTYYAGSQQAARSTYVVVIDILLSDPNDVPRVIDWVSEKLVQTQKYKNIRASYLSSKDYGFYEEKELSVGILTLRVVYVN